MPDLVEVRITAWQVDTNRYGTLSNGDLLRTDAAFARHLVEDCAAAEYTQAKTEPAQATDKPKRTRKPKGDEQ